MRSSGLIGVTGAGTSGSGSSSGGGARAWATEPERAAAPSTPTGTSPLDASRTPLRAAHPSGERDRGTAPRGTPQGRSDPRSWHEQRDSQHEDDAAIPYETYDPGRYPCAKFREAGGRGTLMAGGDPGLGRVEALTPPPAPVGVGAGLHRSRAMQSRGDGATSPSSTRRNSYVVPGRVCVRPRCRGRRRRCLQVGGPRSRSVLRRGPSPGSCRTARGRRWSRRSGCRGCRCPR